jgi:hypothetical protein
MRPRTKIFLRIHCPPVEAGYITRTIGLEPTRLEPFGNNTAWYFDSRLPEETEWPEHLLTLLNTLEPHQERIRTIAQTRTAELRCDVEESIDQETVHCALLLDPVMIESIFKLGVGFEYWHSVAKADDWLT